MVYSLSSNSPHGFSTQECSTADEFLGYLQPRHPHWSLPHADKTSWIFRGQGNAEWQLLPSAMRKETNWFDEYDLSLRPRLEEVIAECASGHDVSYPLGRLCDLVIQIASEELSVNEFIEEADRAGHSIPLNHRTLVHGDPPSFEAYQRRIIRFFQNKQKLDHWRSQPISIEWALAQHHRIPTRLLDWTLSPFTAAYFALEDAVRRPIDSKQKYIAVWAFNYVEFPYQEDHENGTKSGIHLANHRSSSFSYLRAQSGLFMFDANANEYFLTNGRWRGFEEALVGQISGSTDSFMRKITLPVIEAFEALRLLAIEGITISSLMPSLDTVSQTIEMNRRIKRERTKHQQKNS